MKGLKIWGWILFTLSTVLFWTGVLNGDFSGHGIYKMNNGALALFILSTVCFILAITVWVMIRAIQESQTKK